MQPVPNWYDYHQYREQKGLEQAQEKENQNRLFWAMSVIRRVTQALEEQILRVSASSIAPIHKPRRHS